MFYLVNQIGEILRTKLAGFPCAVRTAVYHRIIRETVKGKTFVVMPLQTAWVRQSRGSLRQEYTVAIIAIDRGDADSIDYGYFNNLFNSWAKDFLIGSDEDADSGGVNGLEGYSCMGVTTIDGADVGFLINPILETSTYIGGLKLTFWK